jgi:hypothetical protein
MKRVLAAIGFVCLVLPAFAQKLTEDHNAVSVIPARPEKAELSFARPEKPELSAARPEKAETHNFFNWKNSIVFGVQTGGVVWYARERNGTLSNVTNLPYWQRTQYLKNAYLQGAFFALAADGAAYGIHKSGHGWKRHLAEHLLISGSTAALYLFAFRNRNEYNTQECRFGETQFCK